MTEEAESIEPVSADRIRDPDMGGMRDPFPGEIIPENEKTPVMKAMDDARNRYLGQMDDLKRTGKMTPEIEDALTTAADAAAQIARERFIKQNKEDPFEILKDVLSTTFPGNKQAVENLTNTIDNSKIELINFYQEQKAIGKVISTP